MRIGCRETDALGRAPQPFQIVILSRALAENVHDKITVVEQHPFRAGFSFAVRDATSVRARDSPQWPRQWPESAAGFVPSRAKNIPQRRRRQRGSAP